MFEPTSPDSPTTLLHCSHFYLHSGLSNEVSWPYTSPSSHLNTLLCSTFRSTSHYFFPFSMRCPKRPLARAGPSRSPLQSHAPKSSICRGNLTHFTLSIAELKQFRSASRLLWYDTSQLFLLLPPAQNNYSLPQRNHQHARCFYR